MHFLELKILLLVSTRILKTHTEISLTAHRRVTNTFYFLSSFVSLHGYVYFSCRAVQILRMIQSSTSKSFKCPRAIEGYLTTRDYYNLQINEINLTKTITKQKKKNVNQNQIKIAFRKLILYGRRSTHSAEENTRTKTLFSEVINKYKVFFTQKVSTHTHTHTCVRVCIPTGIFSSQFDKFDKHIIYGDKRVDPSYFSFHIRRHHRHRVIAVNYYAWKCYYFQYI